MKKSNLFKIVNGVKVYASFYKELKKDERGNLYEGSTGGYFVEDGRGGTMFLYWDLAVIYAEFISYGLTPREAWEAACAFFDDPDHARVNYVPGLIIDTCLNKGRAAAIIEAREAAANVSEEKETAEEITAATIKRAEAREEAKEAESTADDAQAAESSAAVVPAAVDAIKAAFKKVPALLVRLNVLVLRVLLIALLLAGAFALVPLTGNTVAGLVGSGVLPLLFITVPCVFAVCFVWGYANAKLWDAICIFK